MTLHKETERTVTVTVKLPVYGIQEHVSKTVDRMQNILDLNFNGAIIESVDEEIEDPDQLEFKYG